MLKPAFSEKDLDHQVVCRALSCGWHGAVRDAVVVPNAIIRCPKCSAPVHYTVDERQ